MSVPVIGPRVTLSQPTQPGGPLVAEWTNPVDSDDLPIQIQQMVAGVLFDPIEVADPRDMVGTETYSLPSGNYTHNVQVGVRTRYVLDEGETQWGPFAFTRWNNALIPGPGFGDGSALQYFEANDERLAQNVGRPGKLTRETKRWEFDGRGFRLRDPHTACFHPITRWDGPRRKGLCLGNAAEQLIELPHAFDAGDWDDFASGVTLSPAPSLFQGEVAQLVSGDSADFITHEVAGTTAGARTFVAVIRAGTAGTCKLRVWDEDASAYIVSTTVNVATGELTTTGSGTARKRQLGDGEEARGWLVWITFTQPSAHELWIEFWPNAGSGTAATEAHYLACVTGSAPTIISGPANTLQEVDALTFEAAPCASHVGHLRLQPLEANTSEFVLCLAGEPGEYPRLELYNEGGKFGLRYVVDVSTEVASEVDTPAWAPFDDVECATVLELGLNDEDDEMIRTRFGVRVNGLGVLDGDLEEVEEAHPTAWGGDGGIRLSDPAAPAELIIDRLYAAKLADSYTPATDGDMATLLTDVSGYELGAHGDVVRVVRSSQPALPDAIDLAIAYFLARTGRTLSIHGRSEWIRRGLRFGALDYMPDLGANGRYLDQTTTNAQPALGSDGERVVIIGLADWMHIREASGAASTNANLFSAAAATVAGVISGVPVGNLFANPIIGNAPHHMFFNATGPKTGFQFGGSTVEVDYVSGDTVAFVYRRGSGTRKFGTDAETEASAAGSDDITAILASVVQLFQRADDSVAAPSVKLTFLHTENVRVSDVDLATFQTHLATIKQ